MDTPKKPENGTGFVVIALLAASVIAVVAMWKVQSSWNVSEEVAPVAMFEP